MARTQIASDLRSINHVSASGNVNTRAPGNLKSALSKSNPDCEVWKALYKEEYTGLLDLDVFTPIGEEDYRKLIAEHHEDAMTLPMMNIFTIKDDKEGNPLRAKSQIVALSNLELREWTCEDC